MKEGDSGQRVPSPTEKKGRTPFIIKTGLGYRYKQSVVFCLVAVGISYSLLLLGGVPVSVMLADWATWFTSVLIIFTAYIFRNTILEFDSMFNLLGESKEDRTGLVKGLFVLEDQFGEYRLRLRKMIRSRLDLVFGTMGLVAVIVIGPAYWKWTSFTEISFHGYTNALTTAAAYDAYVACAILGFLLGAGAWMVIAIITSVNLIGKSPVQATQQTAIATGDKAKPKPQDKVGNLDVTTQFFEFHRSVREIGAFMYRLCLKLTVVAFIWIVFYIGIDWFIRVSGYVEPATIFASIILMLAIFSFFIIPQLGTHGLLARKRDDVLRQLDIAYGRLNSAFLRSMQDPDYLKGNSTWKDRAEIREDSQVVKEMLSHVKGMGVWSFSFPTVLKLVAATALPLLAAILQALGMGLLTPIMHG